MNIATEPSATPEEVAAIVAALQATNPATHSEEVLQRVSPWRLAGREYDASSRLE